MLGSGSSAKTSHSAACCLHHRRTIIDWDDIRFFLGVARGGSVRAASERLGVNHATVLRRIGHLEDRLGSRLFDRLPSGYRMTDAAEDVFELAEQMEASSHRLEARVVGRDQRVGGTLRVTMAPTIATHLLMPDFVAFARRHPEMEITIDSKEEPVNLTNREADVAIRVVYDRATLPPNLHGVAGPDLHGGVYASRALLAAWRGGEIEHARWLHKDNLGPSEWAQNGVVPMAGVPFWTTHADAQLVALRQAAGIATLPCFVGDTEPLLSRVPGTALHKHGTLWLLTQGETRKTKRVRLLIDFLSERLSAYEPLLTGRAPSND